MRISTRHRVLTYVLIWLSVVCFTYADHNLSFFILGTAGLVTSWLLVETSRARTIPNWIINLGVIGSTLDIFYELIIERQESYLSPLGHFMIILTLCILFKNKSRREFGQLLTLSALLVTTASIFTNTLLFALVLTCYLILAFYLAMIFHLEFQVRRLPMHSDAVLKQPLTPQARKELRRLMEYSIPLAIFIGAITFVVFPRDIIRERFSGYFFNRGNSFVGFSERVSFSNIVNLKQSQAVAFQVKLSQNDVPMGSEFDQYYFRAMTLDLYSVNDKEWLHSRPSTFPMMSFLLRNTPPMIDIPPDRPLALISDHPITKNSLIKQQYTVNSQGVCLFYMPTPVSIASRHINGVRMENSSNMMLYHASSNSPTTMEYEIESLPLNARNYANPPTTVRPDLAFYGTFMIDMRQIRQRSVPLPSVITEYAHQWADPIIKQSPTLENPKQLSAAATRMIANSFIHHLKDYPYSLQTHQVDSKLDPTADFLLNRKNIGGHCEYFASSMVLLCTAMNIPARLATGYYGGEYNPIGGFYTVRQLHAHAWVEVYIPNEGWTTFDPTPASSETKTTFMPSWLTWMQEMFQTMEHEWFTKVISFDENSRKYLTERFVTPIQEWGQSKWELASRKAQAYATMLFSDQTPLAQKLVQWSVLTFLFAVTSWLVWFCKRLRKAPLTMILHKVPTAERKRLQTQLGFYNEFIRILARSGMVQHPSQTPKEYAERVVGQTPSIRDEVSEILHHFYDIRFGGAILSEEERAEIRAALVTLKNKLR